MLDDSSLDRAGVATGDDTGHLIGLLDATAVAVAGAETVDAALRGALQAMCHHLDWPLGAAYLVTPDGYLELRVIHHDEELDPACGPMRQWTEVFRPRVGEALVGAVAASDGPMSVPDVRFDPRFVRGRHAADPGVRTWIGIPIHVGGEIAGVVELFAPAVHDVGDVLLATLRHAGAHLGGAIERNELRTRLAALDHSRSSLLSRAAHEIRTPIGVLGITLDALLCKGDRLSDDDRRQLTRTSNSTLAHLRALTGGLLELANLEEATAPPQVIPVPMRRLLTALAAELPCEVCERLHIDVPDDLVVLADETALARILHGLVMNAWQHGGPPITLSADADGACARIRVTDDGPGVAAALVPTLFEPFTRRHDGDVPGLGLALAVGSRLAMGFGATLSYEPAVPTGACFELRVPIEQR